MSGSMDGQAVGAMPPHPLDGVFDNVTNFREAFIGSPLFELALAKAVAAYRETQQAQINNPELCGASPQQEALRAFLSVLNDE
jgi:hypothetical protein